MRENWNLAQAARALRAGRLTASDLLEQCLARIDQWEEQVRAWVLVARDDSRRQAREADLAAVQGHWLGPLHGIPIGIKDLIDVEGWPTRAGSPLTTDRPAAADAPLVARLRAAGAILVGKTVTTEFASFDPPPTRNPWNLACTPGGSSSGSAAAVALGMCLAAIGSQTGGSITRPASYCGIAGCKPTFQLISDAGVVPLTYHLDHPGPMARRVEDLAILLQVLADPAAVNNLAPIQAPAYASLLNAGHRPRLGTFADFFHERSSPAVRQATATAIQRLAAAGATIHTLPLPAGFDEVHTMHRRIMAVEAAHLHRDLFAKRREQYGAQITTLLNEGLAIETSDYVAAIEHQSRFRHAVHDSLQEVEAILLPATCDTAPHDLSTTGDPVFNSPWSYAGVPAVSIPCSLAENGLPVAMQLIGPALGEAQTLAAAAWCEGVFDFSATPSLV